MFFNVVTLSERCLLSLTSRS